ncbi:sugar ABC transporter permease [Lactococcus hodotermopsidis]|uniref:Sugar ABC transporter permease n=1 Tax=Pseudolactococcus hodotermopsidis TaxID=2709157 RepID=A0A6A0BC36_9LACT|nr:ABC transporter permease [Lactococcus hodotermopsidis]GFH42051.1 sugar ABC transporter permease [Lactococcus hodotermopsidis]
MDKTAKKFSLKDLFLKYSVYVVLIVLLAYFSIGTEAFLSVGNIGNFFRSIPMVGILTIAYTMILITGYVDLSIASVAAFSGTAAVYLATKNVPAPLVILIALAIGGAFGAINGLLIKKLDLPSFILTLGTNYVIRGIIMFITNGIYVTGAPDWFHKISQTHIIGDIFFMNTLIFVLLIIAFVFIMNNTRFGKYCYIIGSNQEAARLSGINTDWHVVKVFIIEGILAAVAGVLMMSNLNVGGPNEGQGLDGLAMAAAIMGGTSFSGGIGTIGGAIVGILTLQVFTNGLTIMGVNAFMQNAVTGGVIILAIIIDYLRRKAEKA